MARVGRQHPGLQAQQGHGLVVALFHGGVKNQLRVGVDRLDHGNRSLEDPVLTARLARSAMTLTVCPLSNVKLCNVASIDAHPIDRMLRLGLRATVNSDDPAYFGGYIGDNYRAVARARHLDRADLATLARNSFLGSFLPDAAIAAHLARLDAYCAAR